MNENNTKSSSNQLLGFPIKVIASYPTNKIGLYNRHGRDLSKLVGMIINVRLPKKDKSTKTKRLLGK